MDRSMQLKNEKLGNILTNMKKVVVAFSGGIDSTFLLKRAQQELGDNVLAVVVASELFREEEFDGAVALAEKMGVRVIKTEMKELDNPSIVANTPESWYHSKNMLYKQLNTIAAENNISYVLDGMIMDDLDDFRPGLRARTEAGVRSLLQEVNLYKQEIRDLSRQMNIPIWNKPASCSLASRFPYGTTLTREKINRVNEAELFLMDTGFEVVRVRDHEDVARIEVLPEKIGELVEKREQIQRKLQVLGFTYVSIDLEGYRTGSMNETLPTEKVKVNAG